LVKALNETTLQKGKKIDISRIPITQLMIPIAIIVMSLVFGYLNPSFFSWRNIQNISRQSSIYALVAVGQTIVIIGGGIDLSQGSIIGLISCVAAVQIIAYGVVTGIIITLILCIVIGLAQGILVSKCKIAAFIVTLGAQTFLRGLTYVYTNGMPIGGLNNPTFLKIGSGSFIGVPIPAIIALLGIIFGYIFLSFTRAGREIYAIGGNEEAALLSGINVNRRKILAFVISALFSGIAGLVLTSRIAVGQPSLGDGYSLQAIAACVIGGTSLEHGEGSMIGTFLGVVLIAIIGNGLNLLRVSSFVQYMVNGAIIVLAVGVDVWQKKNKK